MTIASPFNGSAIQTALSQAAVNSEPGLTLFKNTTIGGRPLGDINNSGTVSSFDTLQYSKWRDGSLTDTDYLNWINNTMHPYMLSNPVTYASYITPASISLSQIQTEFGGSNPISLSEYYRGGGIVRSTLPDGSANINTNVPTSGLITMSNFYGGQGVFVASFAILSNYGDFNLGTVLTNSYGWNGVMPVLVTVTVNSGITVYGSSSATAFTIGSFPAGSLINVYNNGIIAGGGGYGGGSGGAGGPGGAGLSISTRTNIYNNGAIIGGGGGGGGGGYRTGSYTAAAGGAGGAAAGAIYQYANITITNTGTNGNALIAGGGGGGGGGAARINDSATFEAGGGGSGGRSGTQISPAFGGASGGIYSRYIGYTLINETQNGLNGPSVGSGRTLFESIGNDDPYIDGPRYYYGLGGTVNELVPPYSGYDVVSAGSGNFGGGIYSDGSGQIWAEAGYPGIVGGGSNYTNYAVGAGGAAGDAIVQVSGTLSWAGGTPAGIVYGAYPGRVN